MYQTINGPGVQGALSVSTTAIEVKVGGTALDQRILISIQPLDGVIYYGYTDSVSASTGTKVFKGQYFSLEATDQATVYLIAASGTVDVRITETG